MGRSCWQFGGGIDAPIHISENQLEDLRRIILRTINKDQVLILNNVPSVPASITSVLREVSRKHNVPLPVLRRNAETLRGLNLIMYDEAQRFSGVELTELGQFVSGLTEGEEPTLTGVLVQTRSGLRALGSVIKDLRVRVLRMVAEAGSGHLGASLSATEILATLYFMKMRHDPGNPGWGERDRFILSKGHAAPALYAVLAEAGYFDPDELFGLRAMGSILQGHPDTKTPGVDAPTGSLGQGFSIAVGMALAAKMDGAPHRVYVLLGDGELDEGQVWEAALTASHHHLDNIVAIVDRNGYQLSGRTEEVKAVDPLEEKWRAFGWDVHGVDGHDPSDILGALDDCDLNGGRPGVIIARTTKGKGVSFMEGNRFSKGVPTASELERALAELE